VPTNRIVTEAEYDRWKKELSNWGRWGKDDQIGALNLITPAKRRQAAALVKDGVSVSLAGDADTALLYLGVHLFDNCDLEALGEAAAARKRWEFLLTAAPLPIRGGTGSPLNPIATF
jgi:hypothetical protein